ncbi:MAG: glutamine-hydrolyzing GMP synthase, partial [Fimbriimonadales bacterium]|nr:glutamine-hydrolyzing GMP synthase [Fimbriimonadales bacterium]
MTHQKVLVVDFGGQYTQLIVRRIREFGVYSEMIAWNQAFDRISSEKPVAVVLSGGPRSVLEEGSPTLDFSCLEGIPVLGICYGQQLMAKQLGGRVENANHKEYGLRNLESQVGLVRCMEQAQVWMSHGDQVVQVPDGFVVTATTDSCPVAAMENAAKHQY